MGHHGMCGYPRHHVSAVRLTSLQRRLLIILIAAFGITSGALNGRAHSWYDSACCSNRDCEALPDTAVTIESGGYHVRYTAKLGFKVDVMVPFNEAKPSRDEHFHGCANTINFLCLYVPQTA